MKTEEIIKEYGCDKEHSENVSRLSLLFFNKIKNYFEVLKKYDNREDLSLLKQGALLHDIGIYFEKIYNMGHHKAGAKFIIENGPEDIDLGVLACLIRYHRKSLPNEKTHKIYAFLSSDLKEKVNYLASIIKLMDAFDFGHLNLIENFETSLNLNVLTISVADNIMLNKPLVEAIEKKKDFFEAVYKVKIGLEGGLIV